MEIREGPLAATWNCLERPLAATRLELAGAAICGHLRPFAATCSHLRPLELLQAAASGCEWLRVAASGCEWLRVAPSGCEWLRADRNICQSWHLEKNRLDVFFFKFGGWIGRILLCLTKPCGKPYATHVFHSVGKIMGRSINGGRKVEN